MKTLLTLSAIVALAVGAASAAPTIAADAPEHRAGTIYEGFAIVHEFVLRNAGDEELRITGIRATCGCTTTELETDRLAPGESVGLQVLIDSTGYKGSVTWVVYVDSNDPVTPRLTLHVRATVEPSKYYHVSVGDMNYLFYLLVDLRDPDEYGAGHLMGAINIPYEELAGWTDRLPKGVLLILYDDHGDRSDAAAQALIAEGFNEARSLLGGFDEWMSRFDGKFVLTAPSDP